MNMVDSKSNRPEILVLMSVYNGQEFLDKQLESIEKQKNVNIDLLIRDDGSSDQSIEIINKWSTTLNITVSVGKNIGAKNSFLKLIEQCPDGYDYYAFADQDDYWMPDKLEVAVQKLNTLKDDKPGLYYSTAILVDEKLERINNPFKKQYHTEKFNETIVFTGGAGCTMVWDRKMLHFLKKHYPDYCLMHDEWILHVCSAIGGNIVYDPQPHMLYRQHTCNVVGGINKLKYNKVQLLVYRIKKFFDFNYKPANVCNEILNGYKGDMPYENQMLAEKIVKSKKSFFTRMTILVSRKYRTKYWIYNLKFKVQLILNKL